ncbi:MAG: hypothetical protein ABID63_10135 [Pseudomonadota bacterium]
MLAQAIKQIKDKDTPVREFACLTGSMILLFSAIESYSTSVAFSLPKIDRFKSFDYDSYRQKRTFWEKLELLCDAVPIKVDKSEGLFQQIEKMRLWRNLVTHSSPYEIEPTKIENTVNETRKLHYPQRHKNYPQVTNLGNAKLYYNAAYDFIMIIKDKTGIEPRAKATYKV